MRVKSFWQEDILANWLNFSVSIAIFQCDATQCTYIQGEEIPASSSVCIWETSGPNQMFVVLFQRYDRRWRSSPKSQRSRMMMTSLVTTPVRGADEAPGGNLSWMSRVLLHLLLPPLHPPSQQQQHSPRRWVRAVAAPLRACVVGTLKENPSLLALTLRAHLHPSSSRHPPPRAVLWWLFRVRRWRGWRSYCVQSRWTPAQSSCSSRPSHKSRWRGRRAHRQGTTPCPSWSASASHSSRVDCCRSRWNFRTYCEQHLSLLFVRPVFSSRGLLQWISSQFLAIHLTRTLELSVTYRVFELKKWTFHYVFI